MGDRTAEMLNICIAIIAVVALMCLGFAVFTISKRMGNKSQNDLVNQLDGISNSMYTDLDQQVITGARLKQVIKQAATTDCAIIISTLGFNGATASVEGVGDGQTGKGVANKGRGSQVTAPEATLNGNVAGNMLEALAPVVQLEDMPLYTALDTKVFYPLALNFGSILKNSITSAPVEDVYTSALSRDKSTGALKYTKPVLYDKTAEYNQTIKYKDGQFTTKLEFATNSVNSKVLRYETTGDFDKSGKTFSISDTSQYNSYVLCNASGDYMGLVFCQLRK